MPTLTRLGLCAAAITAAFLAAAGCSNSGTTGTDMGGNPTGDLAMTQSGPDAAMSQDLLGPLPDIAGDTMVTRICGGFAQPFGAFFDKATQSWYISNVAGDISNFTNQASLKDGRGWITKMSADYRTIDHTFFTTGLNSPAGLRVVNGKLYVPDVDQLVVIDVAARTAVRSATVAPAISLIPYVLMLDVDVDGSGVAYAPEAAGSRILKFATPTTQGASYTAYTPSPTTTPFPTTVFIDGTNLVVGTTGNPMTAGSMGALYTMKLTDGTSSARLGTFAANFQGIELDPTSYLVGTTRMNVGYRVSTLNGSQGSFHDFSKDGVASMGDIGWDSTNRILAVPDLGTSCIYFFKA